MEQKRNISLDILRVSALLGVITIHTAGSPIYHGIVDLGTLWWMECKIMDVLVRWSVPVFYFALHHPIKQYLWVKGVIEVSKVSLGIYLVHMFVLIELFSRMYRCVQNPLVFVPLCVFAVFLISTGGADYQQDTICWKMDRLNNTRYDERIYIHSNTSL